MEKNYFPFFIDITGYQVLVVGGGKIALRRTSALLRFGAVITVLAPEIRPEFQALKQAYGTDQITLREEPFTTGMTAGFDLVLTATDSGETDRTVWQECRDHRIMVNVASDHLLCDFRFPALIETEDVVVGVTSRKNEHGKTRSVSARIRTLLDNKNRWEN